MQYNRLQSTTLHTSQIVGMCVSLHFSECSCFPASLFFVILVFCYFKSLLTEKNIYYNNNIAVIGRIKF